MAGGGEGRGEAPGDDGNSGRAGHGHPRPGGEDFIPRKRDWAKNMDRNSFLFFTFYMILIMINRPGGVVCLINQDRPRRLGEGPYQERPTSIKKRQHVRASCLLTGHKFRSFNSQLVIFQLQP